MMADETDLQGLLEKFLGAADPRIRLTKLDPIQPAEENVFFRATTVSIPFTGMRHEMAVIDARDHRFSASLLANFLPEEMLEHVPDDHHIFRLEGRYSLEPGEIDFPTTKIIMPNKEVFFVGEGAEEIDVMIAENTTRYEETRADIAVEALSKLSFRVSLDCD